MVKVAEHGSNTRKKVRRPPPFLVPVHNLLIPLHTFERHRPAAFDQTSNIPLMKWDDIPSGIGKDRCCAQDDINRDKAAYAVA